MIKVLSTNIISPLGETVEQNYKALLKGRSALARYDGWHDVPDSFTASFFTPEQIENLDNDEICVLPLPTNRILLCEAIEKNILSYYIKNKPAAKNDDDRAIIEQAKMKLIKENMMTEPQAHRFIQKRSMDTGSRMVDTARHILSHST